MTGDQWLLAALGLVVVLAVALMCTAPGCGPAAYAALLLWLAARAEARHYHRYGHRHARPTVAGRTRALARRALALRLRTPATPADTVPTSAIATLPDIRQFVRPTC